MEAQQVIALPLVKTETVVAATELWPRAAPTATAAIGLSWRALCG